MMKTDKRLCETCFAWNAKAWSRPFLKAINQSPIKQYQNALEIGAGTYSSISPFLTTIAQHVECSFFDKSTELTIRKRNERLLKQFNLANKQINYSNQDILNLRGQYDLIIVKSVSGGIFRMHNSNITDFHKMIDTIVTHHLTHDGELFLIENGESCIAPLIQQFGARANAWRFFHQEDFKGCSRYYSFGVLNSFSLSTRMGYAGSLLEHMMYYADRLLSPLLSRHSIHVAVYKNG